MPMWPTLIELAVTPVSVAPPTAPAPGAGAPGVAGWPGMGVTGALPAACRGVLAAPADCLAAGVEALPDPAALGEAYALAPDGDEAAPGVADWVGAPAVSVPVDWPASPGAGAAAVWAWPWL